MSVKMAQYPMAALLFRDIASVKLQSQLQNMALLQA